ncbi:MAG: permease [bacterium]
MHTTILDFLSGVFTYVLETLKADSLYLFLSILIAAALSVYLDANKAKALFLRYPRFMVRGSVAFGAFTPLCACGTMAVIFSLVTTALPWGPIMAFLVSSPLMSPDTFILFSGILGMKFTIALTVFSVLLGLGSGIIATWIEKHTRLLEGQLRITKETINTRTSDPETKPDRKTFLQKLQLPKLVRKIYSIGLIKIVPLFVLFIVIAYVVKEFIPAGWIITLFSGNKFYSVPLAALIGLPLYVSDATVVPLLDVLRQAGASDGAVMAFMITGPATSMGVIGGLTLIMKRKALTLYVLMILVGSVASGLVYNLIV